MLDIPASRIIIEIFAGLVVIAVLRFFVREKKVYRLLVLGYCLLTLFVSFWIFIAISAAFVIGGYFYGKAME